VLLDHFGEAEGRLRWATDKKLQLDVALIKAVHLLEEASLSDVLDILTALRGGAPLPERPVARPQAPSARPTPTPAALTPQKPVAEAPKVTPLPAAATQPAPVKVEKVEPTPAPVAEAPSPTPDLPRPASSDPWQEVAMKLAADSPLKFGWVEDGRFIERIGNAILVEFPPSIEQQSQTLFWPQAVKKIEEQLAAALGGKITFEYRFTGEEPPAPPEPAPSAPAAPRPSAEPNRSAKPPEPAPKAETAVPAISAAEMEEFKSDPLIRKALEVLKAEILIDPPATA
jgi:DNA polymerase-3 subunit gamma/tau